MIIQSYSTTADSEHSAMSSLYPLENGMAFAQYSGNKYNDIQNPCIPCVIPRQRNTDIKYSHILCITICHSNTQCIISRRKIRISRKRNCSRNPSLIKPF